ncbi:MAG: hypothetical protein V1659_04480 [Candidatus Woesearchaeota archaeon]
MLKPAENSNVKMEKDFIGETADSGVADPSYSKISTRYKSKLKKELGEADDSTENLKPSTSMAYQQFREEYLPKHMTYYENLCNWSEKIINIQPDKNKIPEFQEAISICHLNVTPAGVASFAILGPLILILAGSFLGFVLTGGSLFFVTISLLVGVILMIPLGRWPILLANIWRLGASNQMVLCVFYMVTYMRHTSNLELAINFAAEHLGPPLSLDMRKILWNVESEKYDSLKESLDSYLLTWRKWNDEFIEAVHLIESSLYETMESRRIEALDKSLNVILEETYEKMLHYAHNLKSPINTLNMMGVVLPILGLVILPLVVSFMGEVKWWHLATIYNVLLTASVYYLSKMILSKRPTGYGASDISEKNPEMKKYKNIILKMGRSEIKISPIWLAGIIFVVFFLIGISPVLVYNLAPGIAEKADTLFGAYKIFDYRNVTDESGVPTGEKIGPYGLFATLISLFIPLAFGIGLGVYYKLGTKNIMKIREDAKKLEDEFASALFQLGNRLGDGVPAEVAFNKVAAVMEDTASGDFFRLVALNITKIGMSVEQAIFDPKRGALLYYPSSLIESTMKVLIESSKKGPLIASQALINVSEYIKEMHRVDERLKDLLADDISSIKTQISFLAPTISGIVIGITSMITSIIGSLSEKLGEIAAEGATEGVTGGSFLTLFGNGIPTFYFQAIVGVYVVQIVFILTTLSNGIENGADKLSERYLKGQNLVKTTLAYTVIALVVMIIFNFIAGTIITSLNN